MERRAIKLFQCFKPSYDELNTYIITLICILLLVTHLDITAFRVGAWSIVRFIEITWMIAIAGLALFGGALSIFNVFVRRPKELWEKTAMAGLAMGANGAAGIAGAMELMPQGWSLLAIAPIWNIATSVLLLYQMGAVRSENVIADDDATLQQVAMATGWLIGVFAICEWFLKLAWPVTFSVSVAYASTAGHFFKKTADS